MKNRVALLHFFCLFFWSSHFFANTPPPCNLPAPTNIRMTAAGASWISIKWDAVAGATSYRVRAIQLPSGVPVPAFVVNTTDATLNNLAPGRYRIHVAAICSSGLVSQYEGTLTKDTIILDIVLNAQPPQGCIYSPGGITHSEPWSGANCYIKAVKANAEVYFQIKTVGVSGISMGKVSGWCDPGSGLPVPLVNPLNAALTDQAGNSDPSPNSITLVQIMEGNTLICKVLAWQLGQDFMGALEEINTGAGYSVQFMNAGSLAPPAPENRSKPEFQAFKILQNPADETLRCQLQTSSEVPVQMTLSGMDGRIWWQQTLPADLQILEINTADLPTGIYLLQLAGSGKRQTRKIAICH
jgi:hypothetical protein